MKKVKKFIVLALGCVMLVGGTASAATAVKAMPSTTVCPSCHTDTGVRGTAFRCDLCNASGNAYKCPVAIMDIFVVQMDIVITDLYFKLW